MPNFDGYDHLLDPESEEEEEYSFLAAPKKSKRRNENVFHHQTDAEDLAFDFDKKMFIDDAPESNLNFDHLLEAECEELVFPSSEEIECFEPQFYIT